MQIFDKRIEAIDADPQGTYVVYLVPGYSWDELAPTHCFGADNKREMIQFLKERVRPCTCEECLNPCAVECLYGTLLHQFDREDF